MLSRRPKRSLSGRRFDLVEEETVILMAAQRSLRSHQDDILRSLRSHQDDNVCHSTPPASSMSRIAGSLTKIWS